MTEPTDQELAELRDQFGITSNGQGISGFTQVRDFTRAVLAKWGTPSVSEELVACTYGDNGYACCEGGPCRADVHNASITTPQPTQAAPSAGRVPLTDEQIEALPLWKRFVGLWPETRREIVQTIERHHGIKGGQHGADEAGT